MEVWEGQAAYIRHEIMFRGLNAAPWHNFQYLSPRQKANMMVRVYRQCCRCALKDMGSHREDAGDYTKQLQDSHACCIESGNHVINDTRHVFKNAVLKPRPPEQSSARSKSQARGPHEAGSVHINLA